MTVYVSQYVPCELAIVRIAIHHFQGDETAACANLKLAIAEGTITSRPLGGFHTKRHTSDDMLSAIVGGTVLAKGSRPVGEDNQELKNWPEGTWLRRELEEVYGQIFAEDGGPPAPDGVVYTGIFYQTEQNEDRRPAGEQGQLSRKGQGKQHARDVEAEALLINNINTVIAKAKNKWPDLEKRPGINQMAQLLVAGEPNKKVGGYRKEAIRKILSGNYKPAKDRNIPGLGPG